MKSISTIQSDVQAEQSIQFQPISWVGMNQIECYVRYRFKNEQESVLIPAQLEIGVNLFENFRGIHMSRLYRLHQEYILNHELSWENFVKFTDAALSSQIGLSDFCSWKLSMQWPQKTRSLISNLEGFRQYPLQLIFEYRNKQPQLWLQFEVVYSSTCPQSASLSLEVNNNKTEVRASAALKHWSATPHAQRSRAFVRMQLKDFNPEFVDESIADAEKALGTPVQTVVKKEDEMQFAELNAQNLMFCEDAVRKLASAFKEKAHSGLWIYCQHEESLHPHNASSLIQLAYKAPEALSFHL